MAKLFVVFALAMFITYAAASCDFDWQCYDAVSCTINTCSGGECNTDSSPCDTVTPVVTSLSFSEHLDYLTFQFAKPVGFSDFDYDCFALFDKGGDLLGDYPFCYFLNDPSKLYIRLGANSKIVPNDAGSVLSFSSYTKIYPLYNEAGPFLPDDDFQVDALTPTDYPVHAVVDVHNQNDCDFVFLDASRSTGSYGRPFAVSWTSTDGDMNTFLSIFNDDIVIQNATYFAWDEVDITMTVTNWLGQTDSYTFTLSREQSAITVLQEEIVAQKRSNLPVTFAVAIPQCYDNSNSRLVNWTGPVPEGTKVDFPYLHFFADDFEIGNYTFTWNYYRTWANSTTTHQTGEVILRIVETPYFIEVTPAAITLDRDEPFLSLEAKTIHYPNPEDQTQVTFIWECLEVITGAGCSEYLAVTGTYNEFAFANFSAFPEAYYDYYEFYITVSGVDSNDVSFVSHVVTSRSFVGGLELAGIPNRGFNGQEAIQIYIQDPIPGHFYDWYVYPYLWLDEESFTYFGERLTVFSKSLLPGVTYTVECMEYTYDVDGGFIYIQDVSGEFVFNADGLPYGGNVEIQQLYDESDSWIFPVLINMPGWIADGPLSYVVYVDDFPASVPSGQSSVLIFIPGPGNHTIRAFVQNTLTGATTMLDTFWTATPVPFDFNVMALSEYIFANGETGYEYSANNYPLYLSLFKGISHDETLIQQNEQYLFFVLLGTYELLAESQFDEVLMEMSLDLTNDFTKHTIAVLDLPPEFFYFGLGMANLTLNSTVIDYGKLFTRNPHLLVKLLNTLSNIANWLNIAQNNKRSLNYGDLQQGWNDVYSLLSTKMAGILSMYEPEYSWVDWETGSVFTFEWRDANVTNDIRNNDYYPHWVTFPKNFLGTSHPDGLIFTMATDVNRYPLWLPNTAWLNQAAYGVVGIKVFDKGTGKELDTSDLETKVKFHWDAYWYWLEEFPLMNFCDHSKRDIAEYERSCGPARSERMIGICGKGAQMWSWSYTRQRLESYGCHVDETTYDQWWCNGVVEFWCDHLGDFILTEADCASSVDCYTGAVPCAHQYCHHTMNWPSQCVTLPVDARCDDHDDCTVDECNLDQGCINREMDCEDEMACTNDYCFAGACYHEYNETRCDDNVACTVDYCNKVTGTCVNEPVDSNCDDGNSCTTDMCVATIGCEYIYDDCDDDIKCTCDYCPEGGDGCVHDPFDEDCDDGIPCTVDTCDVDLGKCTNVPDDDLCYDSNLCTIDYCSPKDGDCIHEEIVCDDKIHCTDDWCDEGNCVSEPVDYLCNDGHFCTLDKCDTDLGRCTNTPVDALCDDDNDCTDDTCGEDGVCYNTPVDCDDDIQCTADSCNFGVCLHEAKDDLCDDSNPCTTDTCDVALGKCVNLVDDLICEDNNPCTIDSCDPELGCVHVDVECMDEITCTFDYCDPELGCLHIVNDTMCDDSKECTHDACNMKFGHCVNIPDDSLCNDNVECTVDTCYQGGCKFTPEDSLCNDKVSCTIDVCTGTECTNTADHSLCDDHIACTTDICDADTDCFSIPNDNLCDDGIACTIDICDLHLGCVHEYVNNACNDGIDCTVDVCTATGCQNTAMDSLCEDSFGCTLDVCSNVTGCSWTPQDNLCDDGIDCTFDCCVPYLGCVNDDKSCPEEMKHWCINCKSAYSRIESTMYDNEMATLRLKTRFVKPFPQTVANPFGETLVNLEINDGVVFYGDAREKSSVAAHDDFVVSSGDFKFVPAGLEDLQECNAVTRGTISVVEVGDRDAMVVCRATLTGFAWTVLNY